MDDGLMVELKIIRRVYIRILFSLSPHFSVTSDASKHYISTEDATSTLEMLLHTAQTAAADRGSWPIVHCKHPDIAGL